MKTLFNGRFEYPGPGRLTGACNLRLVEYENGKDSSAFPELVNGGYLVHLVEVPDNPGPSITNASERVLNHVLEQFNLSGSFVFAESNPPERCDRIIPEFGAKGIKSVTWRMLGPDELREVAGFGTRLTAKLTYFKDTGKYYAEGELKVDGTKPLHEIWDDITALRETQLPGLAGGSKEFIIHVEVPGHANAHPKLLIP